MKVRFYERGGKWWLDIRHEVFPGGRKRLPSGASTEEEAKRLSPGLVAAAIASLSPPNGPSSSTDGVQQRAASLGPTLKEAFTKGMKERPSWIQSKDKATLTQTFKSLGLPDTLPMSMVTYQYVVDLRAKWVDEPGIREGTKLSPSSINHRLSMLSVLLKVCKLPPHGVEHFSVKGNERTRRVADREIRAGQSWLLANSHRQGALSLADMITVAMETGAREGELLDLLCRDIREDTMTLRDTKNGSTRVVTLPEASKRILYGRKTDDGRPFGDLTESQLKTLWTEMRAALGLAEDHEFVFHILRHEAASRLAEAETNAFVLKEIMGHASITTTQRYVKVSQKAMRTAQARVTAEAAQSGAPSIH